MSTPPASTAGSMPGLRLRKVRTERGLSVDDVAQQLRLSPRVISALEEGAFERLPSATYVRGYLRSYAMLLGLAPQQLIDEFNTLPQAAQKNEMIAPTPVREAKSSDAMMRFGTLLVAGVVFGLAALWLTGKDGSTRKRTAQPTTPAVEATRSAEPVAETPPAAEPSSKPDEPIITSSGKSAPLITPAAPAIAAPAAATSTPDANAPHVRLLLRLQEDSWVDVRDAQQRKLVYETLAAGRVMTVEGVAPLSVFLGNVEGVNIELNGQPYDALRHRRGQVARFTLGAGAN